LGTGFKEGYHASIGVVKRNGVSAGYGGKGNKCRRIDGVALALPLFFLDSRITLKIGSLVHFFCFVKPETEAEEHGSGHSHPIASSENIVCSFPENGFQAD
jgi:hypothetical protein